tara:strand:+ start:2720 stop:3346 length:627 start_codon:yes stop_codon:yes gene_type:complete
MKDHRLDLGRYVRNPFNRQGDIKKRLDFDDLFRSKATSGDYPWNPSRFTSQDLLRRSQTRKTKLNPDLNFVGNSPFFDGNENVSSDYELFEGLGRFNRPVDYDFDEGRALTSQRPQNQPDFNPLWVEAYEMSPTVKPGETAKNPMPRLRNPDPNGFLMAQAERRAEDEAEDKRSISQLLSEEGPQSKKKEKKEEREGKETAIEEQENN